MTAPIETSGDALTVPNRIPKVEWTGVQIYVLLVLLLGEVLMQVGRSILSVLQVPMQHDLGLTDAQLGAMLGPAVYLSYLLVTLPVARWAESVARPKLMSLAILVRSLATAACAFVGSFPQLVAARVVLGVGDGGSQPLCYSMVADYFRSRQRGMAMAIVVTGIPIGKFLGPVVGASLSSAWGWRGTFLVFSMAGIVLAPVIYFTIRDRRPHKAPAETTATGRAPSWPVVKDIKLLLGQRPFLLYWIGTSLMAMEITGTDLFTASYFVRQFGLSLTQSAWLTGLGLGVTGLLGTFVGGFVADRFADRRGRSYVLTTALACALSGLFFFITFTRDSFPLAAVMMVMANFSTALKNGPLHAAAQNMSPPHMRATTAALVMMGAMLCAGLGPLLVGVVSNTIAIAKFPAAIGHFQEICVHGRAVDAACKHASAEGLRIALVMLSCIYFVSTGLLVGSAIALRKPLVD